MAREVPLGVLISGSGTNLQAIIDAIEEKRLDASIRVVISNRGDSQGLVRNVGNVSGPGVIPSRKGAPGSPAVGGRTRVAEIGLWLTFDPAMNAYRRPKMESRFPVDEGLVGVTLKPWRPGLPVR